jgi:HEAT repeat protein
VVPWALAQIGDRRAIGPLINSLSNEDPTIRVVVIRALQQMRAREAVPALESCRVRARHGLVDSAH